MAQDLYHYEQMVERALRGVVREAVERAAREGLRGNHHFYIGFLTEMPGVAIPDSLRARYPHDMTIVLQHQFWDLAVGKDSFSVTLSFQKQLERLTVPFAAVRSFADPSVNFALEFAMPEDADAKTASEADKPPTPLAAPEGAADQDQSGTRPGAKPGADKAGGKTAQNKPGAEVVTLDSFRKR